MHTFIVCARRNVFFCIQNISSEFCTCFRVENAFHLSILSFMKNNTNRYRRPLKLKWKKRRLCVMLSLSQPPSGSIALVSTDCRHKLKHTSRQLPRPKVNLLQSWHHLLNTSHDYKFLSLFFKGWPALFEGVKERKSVVMFIISTRRDILLVFPVKIIDSRNSFSSKSVWLKSRFYEISFWQGSA